jgi:hypothetical protein
MVCTSDYVATNTRKTKEGCKKFSAKQAVTQRRPTKEAEFVWCTPSLHDYQW